MNESLKDISFLTVIAGRKLKEELSVAITENGGRLVNIIYGKGSVKASYLMDAFGFAPEENKVVITCLLSRKRAESMINMLTDEFDFNKPNTGIAFTIPVNGLTF